MRIKLNLASQPFRNRTLPWTITVALAIASLLALVFIVAESRRASAEAEVVERDLQKLRKERDTLQAQAAEVRESVPPEELKVLEAAHQLVDRKQFSWSRLFADLEASLPSSVRVGRIGVRDVLQQGGQTRAELELVVVGRTPADVTDMIVDWSRAGVFYATPLTENPKSGRGESGIEWTLRVSYTPRAGVPTGDAPDSTSVASSASSSSTIPNTEAR